MRLFTKKLFYLTCLLLMTVSSGCGGAPASTPTPKPGAGVVYKDCQVSSPGAASAIDAKCTPGLRVRGPGG